MAVTVRPNANVAQRNVERRDEETRRHAANVIDLQRRVAGVLPVAVNVPRAGTAYRFVKPLVLDEQTRVTFRYKPR